MNALGSNTSTAFGSMGEKASNWAGGGGYSAPGKFDFSSLIPGIGGIMQGLFGDSGAAYEDAGKAYQGIMEKYLPGIQQNFNPFIQAGQDALPQMQNALSKMSNPTEFMNNILGSYQESPYSQFLRKYGNQGMTNAASASGMLGSGALMKEASDYNQQLTSRDLQQYLGNVLGINQSYMGGLNSLAGMGLSGAASYGDVMSRLLPGYAEAMGGAAYGQKAGQQADQGALMGGITSFF